MLSYYNKPSTYLSADVKGIHFALAFFHSPVIQFTTNFFKKKFRGHQSFLFGKLKTLFCSSGDVCPGFQSQCGILHLHGSSPVHNGFLRFISGATPANLLGDQHGSRTISIHVLASKDWWDSSLGSSVPLSQFTIDFLQTRSFLANYL